MDVLIASALFLGGIFLCMAMGWSLAIGLALGLVWVALAALHRGYPAREVAAMAGRGIRTAMVVLRVLLVIGCLTALWRASGTIAWFVHAGLTLVTPRSFVLMAFLLSSALSMTFGSAFGVAGTAGVVLAVMARTGGASLAMTAGAVLSGAYLGERLSPASSSAALAAALAEEDQNRMQRSMWRTTPLPLLLSLGIYGGLSQLSPLRQVDPTLLTALEGAFDLHWLAVTPAVLLLALTFFRVPTVRAILASCVLGAILAAALQGETPGALARSCVLGFQVEHPELSGILSGGGVISMANGMCIVFFSCASSGIFRGAELMEPVKRRLERLAERTDLYFATMAVALLSAALLCNQSVALVLTGQMMGDGYRRREGGGAELARALGNTAIPMAALVPWAIAASVPLAAMEAPSYSIVFACFLYLCPLCDWMLQKRKNAGGAEGRKQTEKSGNSG